MFARCCRKTVFHIEYAGPILMHALCYYFGSLIYGQKVEHSYTQTVAFWLVVLHYLKRESVTQLAFLTRSSWRVRLVFSRSILFLAY